MILSPKIRVMQGVKKPRNTRHVVKVVKYQRLPIRNPTQNSTVIITATQQQVHMTQNWTVITTTTQQQVHMPNMYRNPTQNSTAIITTTQQVHIPNMCVAYLQASGTYFGTSRTTWAWCLSRETTQSSARFSRDISAYFAPLFHPLNLAAVYRRLRFRSAVYRRCLHQKHILVGF
jgi:hypothetical protein